MQRLPSFVWIAIFLSVVGGIQQMYPNNPTVLIWCGVAIGIAKIIEVYVTKPVVPVTQVEPQADGSFARSSAPAKPVHVPGFVERVLFAG